MDRRKGEKVPTIEDYSVAGAFLFGIFDMKDKFQYITKEFKSNCCFEAIKAKISNPKDVKIYFCKPRITSNGNFQWLHFMWSDGKFDYDFSDDEYRPLSWYQCFLFRGRIRRFELGFAKRYSDYRNKLQRIEKDYNKTRKRILYNVRPRRTGAEEKENEHGTWKKIIDSVGN